MTQIERLNKNLSAFFRHEFKTRNLTQERVSEFTGYTQPYISKLITPGKGKWSLPLIVKMGGLIGKDISEIIPSVGKMR